MASVVWVFVKICGTTTEEDALLAVALGADAVGFILAPSKRQVAVGRVRDIVKRLPPEVLTVAVVRDEVPARISKIVADTGVRAVQLHGHEPPEVSHEVRLMGVHVIKVFPAGSPAFARAAEHRADIVMVDNPTPGSGQVFDWRILDGTPRDHRLLLAGGLDPDNVGSAIRTVRPWGVDVASGVEAAPGRKDPVKLRAFLHQARAAAAEVEVPLPDPEQIIESTLYDWQAEDGR